MRTALALLSAVVALALIAPLLLLAVPLVAVALGTRALARLFRPPHLTVHQLIQFDPRFGWRSRPNLNTYHLSTDFFRIVTDADGWRGRATVEGSDVVVFGDSFAAGYGIAENQHFANLRTEPRVKPIGIGGYSLVQEFLWMQELAPSLRGKVVVWFVFHGNDLFDNLSPDLHGYRKPFVRQVRGTDRWEICTSHVRRDKWPMTPRLGYGRIHLHKLVELCAPTFMADRAYRACEFLIGEARDLCVNAGASLVVLTIPERMQLTPDGHRQLQALEPSVKGFDPDLPDARLEAICRGLGVPFVAGKSRLDVSCYKPNDCHWNAAGHRRVADLLAEIHGSRRAPESESARSTTFVVQQAAN